MMSKMLRMIILGAPGSGKGTISSRIVRDFGLIHISSGDILRSQILKRTALGLEAQKFMNEGLLVPDEVMVDLICNETSKLGQMSWLLDGFPRTKAQAEALHEREKVDAVVSLEVPHDVIVKRIEGRWTHLPSGRIYNTDFNPPKIEGRDDITGESLSQRNDDKPSFVRQRLLVYSGHTDPLKAFYRDMGLLHEFHGTQSNAIWPHVHNALLKFRPARGGPF